MRIPNPICLFESAWMWLRGMLRVGIPIAGHRNAESERWTNCNVSVIRCERCGKFTVLWEKTARSGYWPYGDEVLTAEEMLRREQAQGLEPADDVATRYRR